MILIGIFSIALDFLLLLGTFTFS